MSDDEIKDDNVDKGDKVDKETEYLAGWKRALADYDNLKKDLARERGDMRMTTTASVIMRVIPVLDNLDTAMRRVPAGSGDPAYDGWVTGIGYIRTQLEDEIKAFGAELYGAVGDPFDANLHDAVGERPSPEFPLLFKEGSGVVVPHIVEVIARGWKIADRVIRPAKVIVNK